MTSEVLEQIIEVLREEEPLGSPQIAEKIGVPTQCVAQVVRHGSGVHQYKGMYFASERNLQIYKIKEILKKEEPLKAREIAERLGRETNSVSKIIRHHGEGIKSRKGKYALNPDKLPEEGDKYECPYCYEIVEDFRGFVKHINKNHNHGTCPVCGKKCRELEIHAVKKSERCEEHYLYYGLISRTDQEARQYAEEYCRC